MNATSSAIESEMNRVFALQKANLLALKRSDAATRIERLKRLRDIVVRRAEDVDAALHADLRKPRQGAANGEVRGVVADMELAMAELDQWVRPSPVAPSPAFAGNETYVLYEPRGVVLLLGAWNFPFSLVLGPLVPIVAAGNSAIVKPNELQPHTSRVVAEILREAFEEREVAVFEGGVDIAEALQELPVDHVFFTGSPAVGKRVMAAAARHLASVTLELGGKCPAVLDEDCDLLDAAAKIVTARFLNAGQLCLSVDHVWVPQARRDALVAAISAEIDTRFYSGGAFAAERMSRLVDDRNVERVSSYIDDAVARGATLVRGGEVDRVDRSIAPALLIDVPLDSSIMNHEIFGPVLPILTYGMLTDVADQIERMGKPLALYIFSTKQAFVDEVLERTSSGGVTVNNVLLHQAERNLPFGGVNGSGIGRYRGIHGFRELSNQRSVFVQKIDR